MSYTILWSGWPISVPKTQIVIKPSQLQVTDVKKIRVLLVDDSPVFREGLQRIISLETGLEIVGEISDGNDVIRQIAALEPDVVILDMQLQPISLSGMEIITLLRNQREMPAIIVLTGYDDPQQALLCIRAGAKAYCSKAVHPERLVEVVKLVVQGHYAIHDRDYDPETVQSWMMQETQTLSGPYLDEADNSFSPLSPREMEILRHVTNGQSNKEIALTLGISQQTVKNHMTSILQKLPVQDRTQAAVYAIQKGWVRPREADSQTPNE